MDTKPNPFPHRTLKPEFLDLLKKDYVIRYGFVFLLVVVLIFIFSDLKKTQDDLSQLESLAPETADTFIPTGFVLVPITLQNVESISAMIGNFAIVDLFLASNVEGHRGRRIGTHLKLLRAPLNPNQFAVLVPENEAQQVAGVATPLIAVLQSKFSKDRTNLIKSVKPKESIFYYKGDL